MCKRFHCLLVALPLKRVLASLLHLPLIFDPLLRHLHPELILNAVVARLLLPQHEVETRSCSPPDFFTAGGMAAAIAVVKALETATELETEALITALEGMTWDTPKGPMTFRPEDHQALQNMTHFKIRVDDNVDWAIPEKVREIPASEMNIPVGRNN